MEHAQVQEQSADRSAAIDAFDATMRLIDSQGQALAFVMRHSIRGPIPLDPLQRDVPLRPEGQTLSRELGGRCTHSFGRRISSPMLRCRDTLEQFLGGHPGAENTDFQTSRELGDPGAFIHNPDLAWQGYLRWKKHELVRRLFAKDPELRGFRPMAEAVARLADTLLPVTGPRKSPRESPRTLACSHDILMSATLSWLADRPWQDENWPAFHEGFCLWRDGDSLHAWYRGEFFSRPLCLRAG